MTLFALLVWCVIFGTLTGLVTNAKGRGWGEGIALGAVLGVIGLVIAAFLRSTTGPKRGWYPSPSGEGERYWNGHEWADLPARTRV